MSGPSRSLRQSHGESLVFAGLMLKVGYQRSATMGRESENTSKCHDRCHGRVSSTSIWNLNSSRIFSGGRGIPRWDPWPR